MQSLARATAARVRLAMVVAAVILSSAALATPSAAQPEVVVAICANGLMATYNMSEEVARAKCAQIMATLADAGAMRNMPPEQITALQGCVSAGIGKSADVDGLIDGCFKEVASRYGEPPAKPSQPQPVAQPPASSETVTANQVRAAGCVERLIGQGVPREKAIEVCIAAVNQVASEQALANECALFRGTHPVQTDENGNLSLDYDYFDTLSLQDQMLAQACGISAKQSYGELQDDPGPCETKRRALKQEADAIWMQVQRQNGQTTPAQEQRLAEIGREYEALKC